MLLSKETMHGRTANDRYTTFFVTNALLLKAIHVFKWLMNIIVPFLVTSLLDVGPILLEYQTVKFLLTEQFSQDAVESYFGDQRSRRH